MHVGKQCLQTRTSKASERTVWTCKMSDRQTLMQIVVTRPGQILGLEEVEGANSIRTVRINHRPLLGRRMARSSYIRSKSGLDNRFGHMHVDFLRFRDGAWSNSLAELARCSFRWGLRVLDPFSLSRARRGVVNPRGCKL